MLATPLSIATKGSHLGHPYGKSHLWIHIGVDRYLVATFRTADQLLRYIPTSNINVSPVLMYERR